MSFKFRSPIFVLVVILIAIGCRKPTEVKKDLVKVTLRQEWFANANFAGAVVGARDFAHDHGLELVVEEGSDSVDPVKLVATGASMFGDAGADRVLLANEKGADLVVIGVVNIQSPVCFVTRAEDKITSPKQFEGRRVGILSGTATEYVYRTLVKREKLDLSKIKEVEAPFDLQTFLLKEYDVRPAFIYDEPVSLDLQNVKYSVIEPRNYGVHFLGTVYFTRRELLRTNPALVEKFIATVADGWIAALKYPDRAIGYLKEAYPPLEVKRETRSLELAKPYIMQSDGRVLLSDPEAWKGMVEAMKDLKLIGEVDIAATVNDSSVRAYYAEHHGKAN